MKFYFTDCGLYVSQTEQSPVECLYQLYVSLENQNSVENSSLFHFL